ncbi:MAG: autotransporter outer membrane beta-barrel domain-containing protein [Desulfovibrionaceae bacterium]|nr:autotransporter outer membrane beta-barrel domain-containing protein [Desulfovibrionaceae bacterium]
MPNFIGTGDGGSHGTSGSDFSGTPADGTYGSIIGGYLKSGNSIVQNNTLTLEKGHTGGQILGGYVYDPTMMGTNESATANNNTVNFTDGTCTTALGGGTAYIVYSAGNASADKNIVNLSDVKFTGDKSQILGGYSFVLFDGSTSANNNSLKIANKADSKIYSIYGGLAWTYAYAINEGSGTATASNNGLGENQDGTLINVSCDLFVGGKAYASTANATAKADSNKFTLSGQSYGDVYGGDVEAGDSGNKKHDGDQSVASASSNNITLTAEEITGKVYGGKAEAYGKRQQEEGDTSVPVVSCTVNADSNELTITKNGTGSTGTVMGGYARAEYAAENSTSSASKNILTLQNGSYYTIIGGKAIIGDGASNAGAATASGNAVSLTNVNIQDADVYGGWAKGYTGSADNNSLTIKNDSGTVTASKIYGGYVEYDDGTASASNNGIGEKQDGTLTNVSSELFVGGLAKISGGKAEATANNNNFTLTGTSYVDVLGGYALAGQGNIDNGSKDQGSIATASGNTLIIEAQDITNEALGGAADASGSRGDSYFTSIATADNNTLSIKKTGDSDTVTAAAYGGRAKVRYADSESSASASGNILNMEGGKYTAVYGGYADSDTEKSKATASYNGQGTAKDKESTLLGITAETFAGGYAKTVNGNATASYNKFSFDGSNIVTVYGGSAVVEKGESEAGKADASGNTLTFSDSTAGKVYGGYTTAYTSTVSADNNAIDFKNSTCTELYGSYAYSYVSASVSADSNSVSLSDTNFTGEESSLYGSYASAQNGGTASASKNSLLVKNNEDSKISWIYGGYSLIEAETSYKGSSKAVASNNGIGEGREGTLKNVSSTYFFGGYAAASGGKAEAEASNNNFDLSGKSYGTIYGGYASAGGTDISGDDQFSVATASSNALSIGAEDITGQEVIGGFASASGKRGENLVKATAVADSNTLTITKTGTETTNSVYGGLATARMAGSASAASAAGNILNMQGGTYKTIYGGSAVSYSEGAEVTANYNGQGTSKDKTSKLSGITAETFTGGYAETVNGNAAASENIFSFDGSNIATVYGGSAVVKQGESEGGKADASGNTLTFSNGTAGNVYGGYTEGYASTVTADNNTINFKNSTCTDKLYGSYTDAKVTASVSADSNSVSLSDANLTGEESSLYGSYVSAQNGGTASASKNSLLVNNTEDNSIVYIYGGYSIIKAEDSYKGSSKAVASYNGIGEGREGTLKNVSSSYFYGGYADAWGCQAEADASNNNFTISGKSYVAIKGGEAHAFVTDYSGDDQVSVVTASSNTLSIVAEDITSIVTGGLASADAENGGELSKAIVNANGNTLNLTKTGTDKTDAVYGGWAEASSAASGNTVSATKNSLTIEKGTYGTIYTSYALLSGDGTAEAGGESTITAATADAYVGAYALVSGGDAVASSSSELTGGQYGTITGGHALATSGKTTSSGNILNLDNAEVSGVVYGGIAEAYEAGSNAVTEGNILTLANGSVFNDEIYAGQSIVSGDTGSALSHGNTVNIVSTADTVPTFDQDKTVIWGGYAKVGDKEQASYGNTLSMVNVKGMTAANIKNFGTFIFELPDMKADETVLTLTGNDADDKKGTTSIVDAQSGKTTVQVQNDVINATGANGGEFKSGDKIYLLTNANGLTANLDGTTTTVKGQTGISLQYDLTLEADGTSLYLTRLANADPVVLPETKPIAEGAASGLALVNESANTATELLRDFSLPGGTIVPFAHVQASSMRHETGSHINVSSVSLAAGLGTGFETGAGNLSVGAFFEYGKGSYTTHNSFDSRSDVDGDGNSWYMGGGILAKMDFVKTGPGHFYLEGSAHMGSLHNEFDSNDVEYKGRVAQFDMDSPYYSLHGGIGYVWNITEEHDLDVYGKYMWTRLQGTDDTLTTSDKFEYDDMDSNRIRLGARYTYKGSERFRPYVGAAYEHEFAGSCESTAFDHSVSAPSFKGSSGMGEIGLMMQPSEAIPLSVNLGVQGYVGQKQGVSGNCSLMYEF